MYVVSKDGTKIGYDKLGEGSALVMVNGTMGHRGYFGGEELAKALSEDFTVIIYDRRGKGESAYTQPANATADDIVMREIEDIEALVNTVGGSAFVYGESSGAALALKAAASLKNKVTKLAMFEPPYSTGEESKKMFLQTREQLEEYRANDDKDAMATLFMTNFMPPEAIEEFKKNSPDEWKKMVAAGPTVAYDYAALGDSLAPLEPAKELTIPVLVLNGSEGLPYINEALDALTAAFPHAERKTLDGLGHAPTPDVLAPVLRQFFGPGR